MAGASDTVTPGRAVITSVIEVVCAVVPAAVPVTVSVYVPANAAAVVVIARFDVPTAAGLGVNVPVTPVGLPVSASETVLLNPPMGATVITLLEFDPATTLSDAGAAVSE